MATFADLKPLPYFGDDWAEVLVAVGGLGQGHPYARGPVPSAFMSALVAQLRSPWQPAAAGGTHRCELCRFNEAVPTFRYAGVAVVMGAANVFIPAGNVIYCAPSLIAHTVDAHEDQPPEVFMQAVMDCPPAGSTESQRQLLTSGGGRLLASARRPPAAPDAGS